MKKYNVISKNYHVNKKVYYSFVVFSLLSSISTISYAEWWEKGAKTDPGYESYEWWEKRPVTDQDFAGSSTVANGLMKKLHIAIHEGNLNQVHWLAPKVRDALDKKNASGDAVIFAAIKNKKGPTAEIVEALLMAGASPNVKNRHGFTALLEAIEQGRPAIAGKLISYGADVTQTYKGMTALHYAAMHCLPALVARLLDKGVDINARDNTGEMALHKVLRAQRDGDANRPTCKTVVDMLIRGEEVPVRDRQILGTDLAYFDPALLSSQELSLFAHTVIQLLQERGGDPNTLIGPDKLTLFHIAAKLADEDLIQQLIELKADINLCTRDNKTPLLLLRENREARMRGINTVKLTELLIKHGAKMKGKNCFIIHEEL